MYEDYQERVNRLEKAGYTFETSTTWSDRLIDPYPVNSYIEMNAMMGMSSWDDFRPSNSCHVDKLKRLIEKKCNVEFVTQILKIAVEGRNHRGTPIYQITFEYMKKPEEVVVKKEITKKPKVTLVDEDGSALVDEDGNAFAILMICKKALRGSGLVHEFMVKATSGDYNHLLAVCGEYCDIS